MTTITSKEYQPRRSLGILEEEAFGSQKDEVGGGAPILMPRRHRYLRRDGTPMLDQSQGALTDIADLPPTPDWRDEEEWEDLYREYQGSLCRRREVYFCPRIIGVRVKENGKTGYSSGGGFGGGGGSIKRPRKKNIFESQKGEERSFGGLSSHGGDGK